MQCFVHSNLPASVVCKKCGKAMCVDCSAFANHSGLCPNCRKAAVEDGLAKISNIKKANTWVVFILCFFVAFGCAAVYFFKIFDNLLAFAPCGIVPFLIIFLVLKRKSLARNEQVLFANLAQIRHTLDKAIPQTGIVNPLNLYQDLDACTTTPRPERWSQLAFIEPVEEEPPTYAAGVTEEVVTATNLEPIVEADHPILTATSKATPSSEGSSVETVKTAPKTEPHESITEDEVFDGQITFKEVIEDLIKAFNRPYDEVLDEMSKTDIDDIVPVPNAKKVAAKTADNTPESLAKNDDNLVDKSDTKEQTSPPQGETKEPEVSPQSETKEQVSPPQREIKKDIKKTYSWQRPIDIAPAKKESTNAIDTIQSMLDAMQKERERKSVAAKVAPKIDEVKKAEVKVEAKHETKFVPTRETSPTQAQWTRLQSLLQKPQEPPAQPQPDRQKNTYHAALDEELALLEAEAKISSAMPIFPKNDAIYEDEPVRIPKEKKLRKTPQRTTRHERVRYEERPVRHDERPIRNDTQTIRQDDRPTRQEDRPTRNDPPPVRYEDRPMRNDVPPVRYEDRPIRQEEKTQPRPKMPPPKINIAPPPRPRPLFSEEEKKIEKERAEMRKELDKLRFQINELYNKTR